MDKLERTLKEIVESGSVEPVYLSESGVRVSEGAPGAIRATYMPGEEVGEFCREVFDNQEERFADKIHLRFNRELLPESVPKFIEDHTEGSSSITFRGDFDRFQELIKTYSPGNSGPEIICFEYTVINGNQKYALTTDSLENPHMLVTYTDGDKERKWEVNVDEFFGEYGMARLKPRIPGDDMLDWALTRIGILKEDQQIGFEAQTQFFLNIDKLLSRGHMKMPFPITPACNVEYGLAINLSNEQGILQEKVDLRTDELSVDLVGVSERGAGMTYLRGNCEILFNLEVNELGMGHIQPVLDYFKK